MMLMYDYSDRPEQSTRKFAKTCVEKKRRDRINKSLDELKDLMALTDERARYQKLEKAEILEMTVNYMRNLKESINHSTENYEHGYQQCSEEIWKLIHSFPNIYPEHRQHLAHHCRQMWIHRRSILHPYQRRSIEQKCLQIMINNSSSSANSLSPLSSKLWKPYM